MIPLPIDCLVKIFECLEIKSFGLFLRPDYKSLFSCLLVNRQWCKIIVPILWRQPKFKNAGFIKTCLLGLNAEEQRLLIPLKIKFPNIEKQPLFEYSSFMKEIHFGYKLTNGVESWLNQEEGFTRNEEFILTITNSLIKMFLRTSKKLKLSVLFDGNILNYAGKNAVKNALMSVLCKNLTSLKLENFCYLDTCLDDEIAEALLKNNTLTYLQIYFSKLNSKFWNIFTYYLCTNSSLKFLILSDFNIGFEDGKKLANAICNNNTLASLCLCRNQLGSEGGKAFADALCKNTTLTSLNLCGNQLGSEGGKAIADALCKNTTLTTLNLSTNQLGPEGGKAIADALCKNTTLTTLNLSTNQLGPEEGKAIADALGKNTTLTSLNLCDNQFGPEFGKTIKRFSLQKCINLSLEKH